MKFWKQRILLVLVTAASGLWGESVEWTRAYELYERTNYTESLKVLLDSKQADASALVLIGQNYYMLSEYKKSTDALEKAAALQPDRPEVFMWLGRSYGRRAEVASPFTAPGYASKARQFMEKAVTLDPHNREAVGDLFEYYIEAPGFLGGGMNKAEALADRMEKIDPAEGHYFQAVLAEHRKQFDTAEQHLRQAVELAPKQVGRVIDLAKFLSNRGKVNESDALFDEAIRLDPNNPRVLFERASMYIREQRNLSEARKLLQQYLRSPLKPSDPSRQEAEALLKKIGA
jgi:cytochrome c-type biogenesis protein CcmH/NrfG